MMPRPRLAEIVRPENFLNHDFKCATRPHDYVDLIDEIARFARVTVAVSPDVGVVGHDFVLAVSHRGRAVTIRMRNQKYADVAPILVYLNARMARRSPRRRLYVARDDGYVGGIVRATAREAQQLRRAGMLNAESLP